MRKFTTGVTNSHNLPLFLGCRHTMIKSLAGREPHWVVSSKGSTNKWIAEPF